MDYNLYTVIMAGGSGERFWPKSRRNYPKQLLPIISKRSMLQETIQRVAGFVSKERIIIVTNKNQAGAIKNQIPWLSPKNIIIEKVSKNTAPCIAVAAKQIYKKDKKAVMVVLPADHGIEDLRKFINTMKNAAEIAYRHDALVTIGIKPDSPHTGYGYIKKGAKLGKRYSKVKKFTEKPDMVTAKKYIKRGNYLWNSGMFIWKVETILNEIKKYIPELYKLCNSNKSNNYIYEKADSISIDYAIMEKTKKAIVIESDFKWDDVGNWAAVSRHTKKDNNGNTIKGEVVTHDVKDSTIISDSQLIAAIGVSNMIIVSAKDAVLICPKEKAEAVKSIVTKLKENKKYWSYL